MKKYVFVFLCFCNFVNGQISSYNKGLKRNGFLETTWYLNKGVETFVTKQTPVGYKESYDELKRVLSHYKLDIMDSEIDESLVDNTVQSLHDFQNLSNSLKIEWSKITMVWRANDRYQINWMCNDEINMILIQIIKK